MASVQPVKISDVGYSTISTGRSRQDNSSAYIASRINDLYIQALSRQAGFQGTRSLKRFIDSNSKDGKKLHKIV